MTTISTVGPTCSNSCSSVVISLRKSSLPVLCTSLGKKDREGTQTRHPCRTMCWRRCDSHPHPTHPRTPSNKKCELGPVLLVAPFKGGFLPNSQHSWELQPQACLIVWLLYVPPLPPPFLPYLATGVLAPLATSKKGVYLIMLLRFRGHCCCLFVCL